MVKIGSIVFVIVMSFSYSAFAKAKKVLVQSVSYSMFGPDDTVILSLLEDGSFSLKEGKKRAKKIAKLKDQASLEEVMELIRQIPADAKLVKSSVDEMCASDGGFNTQVYGEQFVDGMTIESDSGCSSAAIKGAGSKQAKEISNMMSKARGLAYK